MHRHIMHETVSSVNLIPANGGLLKAIEDHASPDSEANQVILLFRALPESQKQDLLNFLRSL